MYNRPYTPPGPTAPPYNGDQGYGEPYGRQQSLSNQYGNATLPSNYGGGYQSSQGYGAQPSTQGYGAQATTQGYGAQATTQGYGAHPSPQGYGAQATTQGYGAQPSPQGYGAQATITTQGCGAQPTPQGYGAQPAYPSAGGYGTPRPQSSPLFPPNTDRAIIQIFQQADIDRSGTIDANELGRLLSEGRFAFPPRTVRLMLHLFADNPTDSTRIGPTGFVNLWRELGVWHEKFMQYDRDNSGTIDVNELQQVLISFQFAIPPAVLDMLVKKYDFTGYNRGIGYGQFIECGFIVKGLTEKFRDQDRTRIGSATFDYTSFMLMVIPFIAA